MRASGCATQLWRNQLFMKQRCHRRRTVDFLPNHVTQHARCLLRRIKVNPIRMTGIASTGQPKTEKASLLRTPCYLSECLFRSRISKLHSDHPIPRICSHEFIPKYCLVILSSFYGIASSFYVFNFSRFLDSLSIVIPLCRLSGSRSCQENVAAS